MEYKTVRIDADLYERCVKHAAVSGIKSVTNVVNIAVAKGLPKEEHNSKIYSNSLDEDPDQTGVPKGKIRFLDGSIHDEENCF